MKRDSIICWACVLCGLFFFGGCRWLGDRYTWWTPPPPRVLSEAPTLDEIVNVVNRNSQLVQSLSVRQARFSGTGFPTLRGDLDVQRPRNFRLRAGHFATGGELDLGSNHELFWLWVKRNPQRGVFFARHEEFSSSAMRRIIPLEPEQMIEAFGLATFDSLDRHEGPVSLGAGRLQIRSVISGRDGPLTKTTMIDARTGWVLEQNLYDAAGQPLATVRTSQHRQDAASGAVLPHKIELNCPASNLALAIALDHIAVNAALDNSGPLWQMPVIEGYPPIDLADARLAPAAATQGASR